MLARRRTGQFADGAPSVHGGRLTILRGGTTVDGAPRSPRVVDQPDAHSVQLMAKHARTFNFAARFLPSEKRDAAIALYAFFRTLDDLVDQSTTQANVRAIRCEFTQWRNWLSTDRIDPGPREPLARELGAVIDRYAIPTGYFFDLLDGLESDLTVTDYEDDAQLQHYCYQVASTVGLAMSYVLGAHSGAALNAAADLGLAMQLTNILRDVGEDLSFGRIYLPKVTLGHFGLSRSCLTELWRAEAGPDERLRALMAEEIARARALYLRGIAGIWLLPADSRLPILIASRLYRRILAVIEANNFDSLRVRASTTKIEKLEEAATAMLLNRLWRRGERSSDRDFHGLSRNPEVIDAVVQR